MLQEFVNPIVAVAFILAALMPIWALWLGYRISRHLYHISVALWQIRDALRERPAETPIAGVPHITTSMFGR